MEVIFGTKWKMKFTSSFSTLILFSWRQFQLPISDFLWIYPLAYKLLAMCKWIIEKWCRLPSFIWVLRKWWRLRLKWGERFYFFPYFPLSPIGPNLSTQFRIYLFLWSPLLISEFLSSLFMNSLKRVAICPFVPSFFLGWMMKWLAFCLYDNDCFLQFVQDKHKYSGIVQDCCCDYETVDHLNEEVLHPLLQELVKTPFFRYFKVSLLSNAHCVMEILCKCLVVLLWR